MDISNELKSTIEREVMIKNANDKAKSAMKVKRPITRRAIEDIREAKHLLELEKLELDHYGI